MNAELTSYDSLVESPNRFKKIFVKRLNALLAKYEKTVNQRTHLDEEIRTAAIEAARNELHSKRKLVSDNAEELHALLQKRAPQESCTQIKIPGQALSLTARLSRFSRKRGIKPELY